MTTTGNDTSDEPALGPVFQNCWVTADIAAAEAALSARAGVDSWLRIPDVHFGPDACRYRGAAADFTAHVSLAYSGSTQLELIEPRSGNSIYHEFLADGGPGLHHVGFIPADYDASIAHLRAQSGEPVQEGEMAGGLMRFSYFPAAEAGGFIELMDLSDDMRAMFDSMIGAGYRNPWTTT